MLEHLGDGVTFKRHETLVGQRCLRVVEGEQQAAVADQFLQRCVGNARLEACHAAYFQILRTVENQRLEQAVAGKLEGEASRLLEVAADDGCGGHHFTEQAGDDGRVGAVGLHALPGGIQADDSATNVEFFEQEALYVAIGHDVFCVPLPGLPFDMPAMRATHRERWGGIS